MRVCFWIAQFRRDAIFQPLRDVVFQPFRLIVNLVPRVVEEIMEETLQQAVVTENLQSAHLARGSQPYSVVFLVLHKRRFLRSELLEHSRNRSSTDADMPRQGTAGYQFFFGAAQL